MRDNIRRNMPLFPIGIVMNLTELSARQIRYYEEHGLVSPVRTDGNRRLYSFNDVDRLLEVKDLIEQGVNMAGIKKVLQVVMQHEIHEDAHAQTVHKEISDVELRKLLKAELIQAGRFNRNPMRQQGDMSRFFH